MTALNGFVDREVVVDAAGGGVNLHIVESRIHPAEAVPLVLVPGQTMAWDSYRKVMPRLSARYHVYALDVRGHGGSKHTPGSYSFSRCALDLVEVLRETVGRRALVSGNSSGGIIGMVAASRVPELVRGLLMEDPPLFSTDWPRFKEDTWVHGFVAHTVETLPDLERYFSTLKIPSQGKVKLMSFPRPLAWVLGGAVRRRRRKHPTASVDIPWLPLHLRLFVRGLSEYDVDFSRACVDGRMFDVDQEKELARVRCPATLIKALSFRHPELGLVGAMDDDDVERAAKIKQDLEIIHIPKPHIVHIAAPSRYCDAVDALAERT